MGFELVIDIFIGIISLYFACLHRLREFTYIVHTHYICSYLIHRHDLVFRRMHNAFFIFQSWPDHVCFCLYNMVDWE